MSNFNNLTGKTFGLWKVLYRDTNFYDGKHTKWFCKCECGSLKSLTSDSLLSGRSTSCGCRKIVRKGINSTHGMSKTRIYHEWISLKRRCQPNTTNSKRYHDRGITVCEEWQSDFMPFYEWAIKNGYDDSLTIDRIDNDKGYYPENCRWITLAEQQSNKSNNIFVYYQGKNHCLRTLCSEIGFPYKTAYRRLRTMQKKDEKIDTEKLFAPIQKNKIAFRYRNES